MLKIRMQYALVWIAVMILCQELMCCTASINKKDIQGARSYTKKMDIRAGGFQRSYRVHVPKGYSPETALPLVVVIHGAFSTAKEIEKETGFSVLADQEDFVVLYPNGMGIFGFLQHWNAGHCCGKAAADNIDDVGFVLATFEDVCSLVNVDRSRIYMVGFSNGGMLTYRFGAEHSQMVAAIAPLAASIGGKSSPESTEWRIPSPELPLPIIIFHGMADDNVPYTGGSVKGKPKARQYVPVAESVGFWVKHNGCKAPPLVRDLYNGSVNQVTWSNCKNGSEVQLYTLKNWGHIWPGKYFTAELDADNPIKGFNAAEIIWQFFKLYRR
jgi:polyhydroxybutyrate depolymerase